jgi:predicted alpha/beta superfamily hydrolase
MNGDGVSNHQVLIQNDTTILVDVEQWTDHFQKKALASSASRNVHIVDTAFYIPQLNRYRRIWIYLPENYSATKKRYPVLYMHDGQNVFDNATSFSGEWGIDETLDQKKADLIVVAIDNGGDKRLNEYAPYDMEKHGKAEGDAYVDFIVHTLQPYIDTHYRTRKSGKHNFIGGSSMGGLISFYAVVKYPKKFAVAAVFSPAFWINPEFRSMDAALLKKLRNGFYFFAGQKEGAQMVTDLLKVVEQLQQHSKANVHTVIRAEGTHSENSWRNEFPLFIDWLLCKKENQ